MSNILRYSAALLLLVAVGLLHGEWTHRWGISRGLAEVSARVGSLPLEVGEWTTTQEHKLAPADQQLAGAVAYISRTYASNRRGVRLGVLLLCGSPGKISTHTPDICFPSRGYTLSTPVPFSCRYGPAQRPGEFLTALGEKKGPRPGVERVFWAWNDSNGWAAPEHPRWTFGGADALCKLYVVRETGGGTVAPQDEPCIEFFNDFLPEVDRIVFGNSDQPAMGAAPRVATQFDD